MRFFILVMFFLSFFYGRENPFKPVDSYKEQKAKATNIVRQYDDFEKKEFTLPNSARVLKYLKVGYQALDGSIQEKKIDINKAIDWHEPLVTTTKNSLITPAPLVALEEKLKTKPILEKKSPKPPKKREKSLHVKKIKKADKQKITQKSESEKKEFSFQDFITFSTHNKQLIIQSNDSLIRDFIITKPHKIALDFKRQNSFYTKTIQIDSAPYKSVTMGSHKNFYRASFLLDGPYTYTIHKEGKKVIINLH